MGYILNSTGLLNQNKSYRAWFLADTSGEVARQIVFGALTLLAYSVTKDVTQTGFISAAMAASRFISMLAGAWIVDFYPKRRLMAINAACRIIISTLLAALLLTDQLNSISMLCIAILYGVVGGIFGNLTNAIIPFIVAQDDIPVALTTNETRDSIIQIAAAPASVMFFSLARSLPFFVDIIGFLIVAIASRFIRGDIDVTAEPTDVSSTRSALKKFAVRSSDGLRWVFRTPVISSVLFVVTLSAFSSFLVINAVELYILDSGQPLWQVGAVFACFSTGMVCGGFLAGPLRKRLAPRHIIIANATVDVLAMMILIFATHWMLLGIVMFLWTLLVIANNTVLGSFQISKTPLDLQGRVGAAFGLIVGLTPICAVGLAGYLLGSLGWITTILIALIIAVIRLSFSVSSSKLRELDAK